MNKKFFLQLFSLIFLDISSIKCDDVVSVNTHNGLIYGRTETWFGKHVQVFLGIPYAEPPIGNLRFRKPVPISDWTEPLNATQQPNPCYQYPPLPTLLNTNISEDCLYLNIWQPVSTESNSSELKAVMFFIHGGGLIFGSSSEYQFQGPILSTKGDVVLVTLNYRLGPFGFLFADRADAPGNIGFWDAILALKWIRKNIKYFGGDKNQITIFGHSGGSYVAEMFILSPITRYLFKQASLMAGVLLSASVANRTLAKQRWLKASQLIGCANETDTTFNSAIMNCLRSVDANVILSILLITPEILGDTLGTIEPVVIDGVFLPNSPVELLKLGNFKKNLNLLFNFNEDDGQLILTSLMPINYSPNSPANLSYTESSDALKYISGNLASYRTVNVDDVSRLYFSIISPNSTDYEFLRLTTAIGVGDYGFSCPMTLFAESLFKHDSYGTNVYQYYYTSKIGIQSVYFCGEWMGTCHGAELAPVFGMPFIYYNTSFDAQRDESVEMIDFYSHFAKHGYPSPQNGINWPKYYNLNGNIVRPYLQINNSLETKNSFFSYGLKITECEYLWKKYIYVKVPN